MPRAFLRVAGITLARHQLGIALRLECERVICIGREFSREMVALQHDVEREGLKFHLVTGPRALSGLVTANDELIVLTDGLLAPPHEVAAQLGGGHAVLVQPVETGLAAGFERIDLDFAAAGAMAIPGRLVERLNELPPDCDAASALTRIALQAGIALRALPDAVRDSGSWLLIRDEAAAHAVEGRWIKLRIGELRAKAPGALIARFAVLTFGPALLHAGNGSLIVIAACGASLMMALGAGWLGFAASAFLLCAIVWVLRRGAAMLERIELDSLDPVSATTPRDRLLDIALDVVLAAILLWNLPKYPSDGIVAQAFVPLVLVGLLRLLTRTLERRWRGWLEDRLLLCVVLAVAAVLGVLAPTVKCLSILLIVAGILMAGPRARLTSA